MRVRMVVTLRAGDVLDLPAQLAYELVRSGYAAPHSVGPTEFKEEQNDKPNTGERVSSRRKPKR